MDKNEFNVRAILAGKAPGIVALYRELVAHAETVRDYVTRDLARPILSDEETHIDFIETQFEMIGRMGLQNYIQLQSEPAESD